MSDQAETDRARIITVTSGKSGVGKTSLAANLALALSLRGHRVCLLDADPAFANVSVLLGLQAADDTDQPQTPGGGTPSSPLSGPHGVAVVSTPANADPNELAEQLSGAFQYLIVDCPAPIEERVRQLAGGSELVVLTATAEPASLRDAFTSLRTLQQAGGSAPFALLLNMLPASEDGDSLYQRFHRAGADQLGIEITHLGNIPMDRAVTEAVLSRRALLELKPDSAAGAAITAVAGQLESLYPPPAGAAEPQPRSDTPDVSSVQPVSDAQASAIPDDLESALEQLRARTASDPHAQALLQTVQQAVKRHSPEADPSLAGRQVPDTGASAEATRHHLEQALAQAFSLDDWTPAHARAVYGRLCEAYRQRFGAALHGQPDGGDDELGELARRLATTRDQLQQRLQEVCHLMESHERLLNRTPTSGSQR